jgi:hypothetical protein
LHISSEQQTMPDSTNRPPARRSTAADRRTRLRLRDLCDEVIASFRLASGRDLLTDAERSEARATLARLTPTIGR